MNNLSSNRDNETLIQQTLNGDRESFGELVLRYQDRLFASLVPVLGCEAEALDVAQDTFVQAFRRLDSFRGQSAFYTWLFRIGRNLAISRIRARKPVVSMQTKDGSTMDIANDDASPSHAMESLESVQQLRCALDRLSEEHRTILVLREMDGLDYDAIAQAIDVPVGTVRSRLHRARLQLKHELEFLGAAPD
jgi:RNA polymerase sigma-70 factor (ECF subfamily)